MKGTQLSALTLLLISALFAGCSGSPKSSDSPPDRAPDRPPSDRDPDRPPFFAAFGHEIMTSVDGVNWKRRESTISNFRSSAYGDGRIVALGGPQGGRVAVSEDGAQWRDIEVDSVPVDAVTYGADKFVAVGTILAGLLRGTAATSPDGVTWTPSAFAFSHGLRSVAYGDGLFIAVGSGLTATSLDGIVWSETLFGEKFPYQLYDVVYGNDTFVVTGNRGSVLTSSDGAAWEGRSSGLSGVFSLRAIAYGSGRFVAVGDEYIVRGEFVTGEGYGTERPVTRSAIIASQDGVSWDVQYTSTSQELRDIVYGNGLFVAIGANLGPTDKWGNPTSYNAVVVTSDIGTDWTTTEVGGPYGVWLSSVTYWPASDGS